MANTGSDVAIIGASLAGLAAARTLRAAGYRCTIFEASDRVGGHVYSEMYDDVTVDHGFFPFNTWYPSLKELLRPGEYQALALKTFQPGIQTLTESGDHAVIGDPVRAPRLFPRFLRSVRSSPLSLEDLLGLRRWLGTELSHRSSLEMRTIKESKRRADRSIRQSLDESGITGTMRKQAIDPILRAFTVDPDGISSELYAKWLIIAMLRGSMAVPENGMGDISSTLARIPGVNIEKNSRVTSITVKNDGADAGVVVNVGDRGESHKFRYAISAVDVASEKELLGEYRTPGVDVPTVGTMTWWFISDEPLDCGNMTSLITVDGSGATPISSAAELTAVAPAYAPGRYLVAGNTIVDATATHQPSDEEMKRYLGQLFGCSTSTWELVTRQTMPQVRTIAQPGRAIPREGNIPRIHERIFLSGPQYATPSMDGALRSGQRAAKNVIQFLER